MGREPPVRSLEGVDGRGLDRIDGVNKTESIRTRIFRAILKGDFAPGDRLPAERDMAVSTFTSRVTVRRAYEQLEKAGILNREQGRGTFVARNSGGNSEASGQIALLASLGDPFALEFIGAVERELSARDLLLVLRLTDETPEKEEEAAVELVGKGVNNLIIWPSGNSFPEKTFERLRVLGANMVFFDRMIPGDYADYVGLDNGDAMAQLFGYAAKRGLKDPVFVTHSDLRADSDRLRKEGFLAQCAGLGLSGTVVSMSRTAEPEGLPEAIGPDSTVFCVNDAMAAKLKSLLGGRLVLGIDGLGVPGIVSCKQPMEAMAGAAVEALERQQRLGPRWRPERRFFRGELADAAPGLRLRKGGRQGSEARIDGFEPIVNHRIESVLPVVERHEVGIGKEPPLGLGAEDGRIEIPE
jgi:DNA-binding LacI/PurR family transcriptional regulator